MIPHSTTTSGHPRFNGVSVVEVFCGFRFRCEAIDESPRHRLLRKAARRHDLMLAALRGRPGATSGHINVQSQRKPTCGRPICPGLVSSPLLARRWPRPRPRRRPRAGVASWAYRSVAPGHIALCTSRSPSLQAERWQPFRECCRQGGTHCWASKGSMMQLRCSQRPSLPLSTCTPGNLLMMGAVYVSTWRGSAKTCTRPLRVPSSWSA